MTDPNHPAYPILDNTAGRVFHGLSKREYFAGLAMHAIIVNEKAPIRSFDDGAKLVTEYAVVCAEALISKLNN